MMKQSLEASSFSKTNINISNIKGNSNGKEKALISSKIKETKSANNIINTNINSTKNNNNTNTKSNNNTPKTTIKATETIKSSDIKKDEVLLKNNFLSKNINGSISNNSNLDNNKINNDTKLNNFHSYNNNSHNHNSSNINISLKKKAVIKLDNPIVVPNTTKYQGKINKNFHIFSNEFTNNLINTVKKKNKDEYFGYSKNNLSNSYNFNSSTTNKETKSTSFKYPVRNKENNSNNDPENSSNFRVVKTSKSTSDNYNKEYNFTDNNIISSKCQIDININKIGNDSNSYNTMLNLNSSSNNNSNNDYSKAIIITNNSNPLNTTPEIKDNNKHVSQDLNHTNITKNNDSKIKSIINFINNEKDCAPAKNQLLTETSQSKIQIHNQVARDINSFFSPKRAEIKSRNNISSVSSTSNNNSAINTTNNNNSNNNVSSNTNINKTIHNYNSKNPNMLGSTFLNSSINFNKKIDLSNYLKTNKENIHNLKNSILNKLKKKNVNEEGSHSRIKALLTTKNNHQSSQSTHNYNSLGGCFSNLSSNCNSVAIIEDFGLAGHSKDSKSSASISKLIMKDNSTFNKDIKNANINTNTRIKGNQTVSFKDSSKSNIANTNTNTNNNVNTNKESELNIISESDINIVQNKVSNFTFHSKLSYETVNSISVPQPQKNVYKSNETNQINNNLYICSQCSNDEKNLITKLTSSLLLYKEQEKRLNKTIEILKIYISSYKKSIFSNQEESFLILKQENKALYEYISKLKKSFLSITNNIKSYETQNQDKNKELLTSVRKLSRENKFLRKMIMIDNIPNISLIRKQFSNDSNIRNEAINYSNEREVLIVSKSKSVKHKFNISNVSSLSDYSNSKRKSSNNSRNSDDYYNKDTNNVNNNNNNGISNVIGSSSYKLQYISAIKEDDEDVKDNSNRVMTNINDKDAYSNYHDREITEENMKNLSNSNSVVNIKHCDNNDLKSSKSGKSKKSNKSNKSNKISYNSADFFHLDIDDNALNNNNSNTNTNKRNYNSHDISIKKEINDYDTNTSNNPNSSINTEIRNLKNPININTRKNSNNSSNKDRISTSNNNNTISNCNNTNHIPKYSKFISNSTVSNNNSNNNSNSNSTNNKISNFKDKEAFSQNKNKQLTHHFSNNYNSFKTKEDEESNKLQFLDPLISPISSNIISNKKNSKKSLGKGYASCMLNNSLHTLSTDKIKIQTGCLNDYCVDNMKTPISDDLFSNHQSTGLTLSKGRLYNRSSNSASNSVVNTSNNQRIVDLKKNNYINNYNHTNISNNYNINNINIISNSNNKETIKEEILSEIKENKVKAENSNNSNNSNIIKSNIYDNIDANTIPIQSFKQKKQVYSDREYINEVADLNLPSLSKEFSITLKQVKSKRKVKIPNTTKSTMSRNILYHNKKKTE